LFTLFSKTLSLHSNSKFEKKKSSRLKKNLFAKFLSKRTQLHFFSYCIDCQGHNALHSSTISIFKKIEKKPLKTIKKTTLTLVYVLILKTMNFPFNFIFSPNQCWSGINKMLGMHQGMSYPTHRLLKFIYFGQKSYFWFRV
jgi:hypothetical protein